MLLVHRNRQYNFFFTKSVMSFIEHAMFPSVFMLYDCSGTAINIYNSTDNFMFFTFFLASFLILSNQVSPTIAPSSSSYPYPFLSIGFKISWPCAHISSMLFNLLTIFSIPFAFFFSAFHFSLSILFLIIPVPFLVVVFFYNQFLGLHHCYALLLWLSVCFIFSLYYFWRHWHTLEFVLISSKAAFPRIFF